MEDVTFRSAALGREMKYRVFLPVVIPFGQRIPVVYLLHGGNGEFRDWSNYSDVSRYARGMLLVMPQGDFSYYMNAVSRPADRYEDYTFHDLIADVESRFPFVARGRDNRAIIGVSMGGFAALEQALSQPDEFAFVGALSPPVDILHRRFNLKRIGEWWRIREIFGPWGSESRANRDPFQLVQIANPAGTPYICLTTGDRDPLFETDIDFAHRLTQRRFANEFHFKPGGHDWGEWNSQIPGCFDSLLKHIGNQERPTQ
jgi:S-formylglutathione hydrolase FrmB